MKKIGWFLVFVIIIATGAVAVTLNYDTYQSYVQGHAILSAGDTGFATSPGEDSLDVADNGASFPSDPTVEGTDAPVCDNSICEDGEAGAEGTCPQDCSYCGDGSCDDFLGENVVNCYDDCRVQLSPQTSLNNTNGSVSKANESIVYCGDGFCSDGEELSCFEDCGNPDNLEENVLGSSGEDDETMVESLPESFVEGIDWHYDCALREGQFVRAIVAGPGESVECDDTIGRVEPNLGPVELNRFQEGILSLFFGIRLS